MLYYARTMLRQAWQNASILLGLAAAACSVLGLLATHVPISIAGAPHAIYEGYRGAIGPIFQKLALEHVSLEWQDTIVAYLLLSATFARTAFVFYHLRPTDHSASSSTYWKLGSLKVNRFYSRWYRYFSIRRFMQEKPVLGGLAFFLFWPLILVLLYVRTFFLFRRSYCDESDQEGCSGPRSLEPDLGVRQLERTQLRDLLLTFTGLLILSYAVASGLIMWGAVEHAALR